MTDIHTAAGALVRVAPSPYAGRAALVFVECAPWRTPGTAQLTEDEARAVRDALTARAADLMGKLAEANRARQAAEAALTEARAEAYRLAYVADAATAEARRSAAPVTLADVRRVVREAALAAYWRTEDSSAELTLPRLAEALDEQL